MKIIVISGPNLNMLGVREPDIYGSDTYDDLCRYVKRACEKKNIECDFFQSNHEGDLVDCIQQTYKKYDGIIINPAAYTHTSVAVRDALTAVKVPAVEVHLSDPDMRERFRQVSYVRDVSIATFKGHGFECYGQAVDFLEEYLNKA